MNRLRNLPVKRKLTIISTMTSAVALILTCGTIIAFDVINSRKSMMRDVLTIGTMIADNSAAALAFRDNEAAAITLGSLSADNHVTGALIYDAEGNLFSTYQSPGSAPIAVPPVRSAPDAEFHDFPALNGSPFSGGYLDIFLGIYAAEERIGTLYLRHDMKELRDNFIHLAYMVVTVMAAASLVAFILSRRLLGVVIGPIINLEGIVRDVASRKDFTLRATKQGDDEVGRLIDGFNEMLGEIQSRDRKLEAARDELETRVIDRTGELARSLEVLHATLDATADGILALNRDGEVNCFNLRYASMWGIPQEILDRCDRDEMLQFVATRVEDGEKYLAGARKEWRDGECLVIPLKDGRIFERYVHLRANHGGEVGAVINFRDVTDRVRADNELKEASKQLLETSRRAGMAEVATSVLHNVGNVLNSVNVSCAVLSDRVARSRIGSVARTAELIASHSDDLPGFLTNHPTGRNLPQFLGKLAGALAADQAEALRELQLLHKNLDHIKEIVAMQQSYAKVSGVVETVDVAELVEDSLRMNEGTLRHRNVTIVRKFSEGSQITLERHKALQILVNLIRNASHACADSGRTDRQLTISITADVEAVEINVADNGTGISADNIDRVFAHGFTTKHNGHGFGLHNGALAAQEMGGSLTVQSDGLGKGATFTLRLPLAVGGLALKSSSFSQSLKT